MSYYCTLVQRALAAQMSRIVCAVGNMAAAAAAAVHEGCCPLMIIGHRCFDSQQQITHRLLYHFAILSYILWQFGPQLMTTVSV